MEISMKTPILYSIVETQLFNRPVIDSINLFLNITGLRIGQGEKSSGWSVWK